MENNKFYNGLEVNMENLKKILRDDNTTGDMVTEEINTVRKFAEVNDKADYKYLLEKLKERKQGEYVYNGANWQTIYEIISNGDWNYNSIN